MYRGRPRQGGDASSKTFDLFRLRRDALKPGVQGIATTRKEIEHEPPPPDRLPRQQPGDQRGHGTTYARLSLAVSNGYRDKSGERQERTDWIPIVAFRSLAKSLEQLRKGARIAVYGRLQVQSYEKDGERKYSTEVVARSITFLTRAGKSAGGTDEPEANGELPFDTAEDDIPS